MFSAWVWCVFVCFGVVKAGSVQWFFSWEVVRVDVVGVGFAVVWPFGRSCAGRVFFVDPGNFPGRGTSLLEGEDAAEIRAPPGV